MERYDLGRDGHDGGHTVLHLRLGGWNDLEQKFFGHFFSSISLFSDGSKLRLNVSP